MRLALAQLNPVVGDLPGNGARILAACRRAAALGGELVLTPELSLWGYPPRDLLLLPARLDAHVGKGGRVAARHGEVHHPTLAAAHRLQGEVGIQQGIERGLQGAVLLLQFLAQLHLVAHLAQGHHFPLAGTTAGIPQQLDPQ